MSKNPETIKGIASNETAFKVWFYLFFAAALGIIILDQNISVASSHAFIGMLFIRQMSLIHHEDIKGKKLRAEMNDLKARMDKIDPYKEE